MLSANGWSWFGDGVGNYGPDYALRAYAASTQPGIGTKDDEVRAVVTQDSDGHALNGANRYVIHFAPNQLPPVRGFWSITAYTKDGALGESAPARLAVGDRNGARRNRDGSLDVTVSSDAQQERQLAAGAAQPICNWCCVCTRRSRRRPMAAGNRRQSCVNNDGMRR